MMCKHPRRFNTRKLNTNDFSFIGFNKIYISNLFLTYLLLNRFGYLQIYSYKKSYVTIKDMIYNSW